MKSLALIFGLLLAGALASAQQFVTSTIAGTPGTAAYAGDAGPATISQLDHPLCLTIDAQGNIYFVDSGNNVIRKITAATGVINTIAGTGTQGFAGDGGPALQAQFGSIDGLAVDAKGNLYISDTTNSRVRMVNTSGIVSTIAGTGTQGGTGNFGPAVQAQLVYPAGLAVDAKGDLYIADFGNATVRMVNTAGTMIPIAGTDVAGYDVFPGDGGVSYGATLGAPYALAVDSSGNLYIDDLGSSSIRKVDTSGIISTVITQISTGAIATDSAGNLYFADYRNEVIDKLTPGGVPVAFAGNQVQGYAGNGGPASYAEFNLPFGIALDSSGNFYISDYNNDVIRALTPLPASTVIVANGASNVGFGPGGGALPLDRRLSPTMLRRRPSAQPFVPVGANSSPLAISPGEIVTIFGADGLGFSANAQAQPDASGLIETQFANTLVTFNGIPGPVLVSAPNQVTAIVPYELAGATQANVAVINNGQTTGSATVPVAASAPGIFTLDSSAYTTSTFLGSPVLNADGTVNTIYNPAAESSNITLYETGEGLTSPASVDGLIATGPTFAAPQLPVTVMINGIAATVVSAAAVQGLVAGVMKIVVTLPSSVTTSKAVPVTVQVGTVVSPTVTIAVK
jgi:uncharacterized protein (TIGR03437 family)